MKMFKRVSAFAAVLGLSIGASQSQAAVCSYKVDGDWGTGFNATITITNDSNSAINGWNIGWQYTTNRITNFWNAAITGGNPYSAKDVGWNSSIAPGQSVNFGVQGNNNGVPAEKPVFTGALCGNVSTSSVVPSSKSSDVPSSKSSASLVPSSKSSTSSISSVAPSSKSSASSSSSVQTGSINCVKQGTAGGDWLRTVGNNIVDRDCKPVWLTGANWFGFNAGERVFHGLWSVNMESVVKTVSEHGLNIIRVPISTQLLKEWKNGQAATTSSPNGYTNAYLTGMTTLQIFDEFLAEAKKYGVKVLLDVHSAEADNSGHLAPVWYKGAITPEDFYSTWEWVADRYKNNDTLVAFDMKNEPHGTMNDSPRAKWDDSTDVDNWKYACETASQRVLAVHPKILVLCEGIEMYAKPGKSWTSTDKADYDFDWWGGNLRGVKDHPVQLGANQNQLVYSPHEYGPLVYLQPWFTKPFTKQSLFDEVWQPNWFYIHEQNIAPLLIGEWGGRLEGGNIPWMTYLRDFIVEQKIHHTFWCINPNSGDTGGLLKDDWTTWDDAKYALLKPVLWQNAAGKFVGLAHDVPLGGAAGTGVSLGEFYQSNGAEPVGPLATVVVTGDVAVSSSSVKSTTSVVSSKSSSSVAPSSKSVVSSSSVAPSSTSVASSSVISGGYVSQHGRLKTVNGRLVDQNGNATPLHGMSTHGLQWFGKFYNRETVNWLRDDWHATVIRAAMYTKEGGYLDNASVLTKVWETVDAAIAADIYVIVDWHILSDGNPLTNKEAAKGFFRQVTAKYGNDPHIIYEIANEPNGADVNWGSAIKPYANEVIPVIRAGAPDAFVIVGTAVWSQRLDQVVADPLTFNNVAYTVHFYACSPDHQDPLRALVKSAADAKLPIFSTEWGDAEYTGSGATCPAQVDTWMNLLDQYGISWVNWNLSDAPETSAALKSGASTTGGWSTSQLTESGNYVRNRMRSYSTGTISSSSKSNTSSVVTTSSSTGSGSQQCNYWGKLFPLCSTPGINWGSENGATCISATQCLADGQTLVGGTASSTVPSSAASSSRASVVGSSASSSVATSVASGDRLDNPFVDAKWYVNQDWANNARAYGGAAIANYNTAVWMDRIGAIAPTDPNTLGLRDHLNAALDQGANTFLVVVYDLPNRDCFALASNGELTIKNNGFNRYKTEYVTPLAAILADPKYKSIRIIAIIEPDSLPNLVTNTSDPDCQEAAGPGGYVEATQFTLNALYPITNVYSYIDIGHSGWLGWPDNFDRAALMISNAIKGTAHGVNSIAGFISNTANSTPTTEPFLDEFGMLAMPGSSGGSQVRQAKFYEWDPYFSELPYVTAWRKKMITLGFPDTIGMLIDTSRNGWGGANRPTKLSTSTDVDKFVDDSRIDRRTHRGMWCNQSSGIGERPTVAPAPGVDAYVWVKPPGESDGASSLALSHDPLDPAKGFDRFCDPTFTVPANGKLTGALPDAPVAGRWFTEGFKVLLKNAYPPL